jgi:hypothetical protein
VHYLYPLVLTENEAVRDASVFLWRTCLLSRKPALMQELLTHHSATSMISKLTLSVETVDVVHHGFELLLLPDPSAFVAWLSNDETRRLVESVIQENTTRVFQLQQAHTRTLVHTCALTHAYTRAPT